MSRSAVQVLIVGANGQLGQALLRKWRNDATRLTPIIVMSRPRESLDVTEINQVRETVQGCKPAIVINCAGYTNVGRAQTQPGDCWRTNAVGASVLGEVCAESGASLIQISSDHVFGDPAALAINPDAAAHGFNETHIPASSSVYARSKLAAELQLAIIAQRHPKFRYWILRTSGLFELAWRPNTRNFLFAIASRLRESRSEIPVVNDVVTTICGVDYLADVVDWLVTHSGTPGVASDTFHVAQTGSIRWYDVAMKLASGMGQPTSRIVPTDRAGYARISGRDLSTLPDYTPLDCRKLTAARGVQPASWHDAVGAWMTHAKGYF